MRMAESNLIEGAGGSKLGGCKERRSHRVKGGKLTANEATVRSFGLTARFEGQGALLWLRTIYPKCMHEYV